MLSVGSLFAGIGGIDLGLERTGGFRTAWFSEIEPFAVAVLGKHWPGVPNLGDVRELGAGTPRVDVLAGGFPCQPVSLAGKRLAQDDPRWLWPHVSRLVGLLRPRYVLLENVPGLRSKGLGDVLQDLSALGYDAEWEGISAAAVGAPHRRDRVWIVAYPRRQRSLADSYGLSSAVGGEARYLASSSRAPEGLGEQREWRGDAPDHRGTDVADTPSVGQHRSGTAMEDSFVFPRQPDGTGRADWGTEWLPEPAVGRVADGVPARVARLRALGNAVVPQVAEVVGRLILADASRAN